MSVASEYIPALSPKARLDYDSTFMLLVVGEMLGEDEPNSSIAHRLWVVAQLNDGLNVSDTVADSDIALGRANGWLTSANIGYFKATDELRKSAVEAL